MSLYDSELTVEDAIAEGWWLVIDHDGPPGADEEGPLVVAGPFAERTEAHWTAVTNGLDAFDGARLVYAARRGGGALIRRPSPEEWAWLDCLGEQLDRLGEDWDELVSDTDPLSTLVVEVAAALAEAGLPLHDCASDTAGGPDTASARAGGVCLTPAPESGGIVVSWRAHDRLSVDQVHGAAVDTAVQQVMNTAVADVLSMLGFAVEPFGSASSSLVLVDEEGPAE